MIFRLWSMLKLWEPKNNQTLLIPFFHVFCILHLDGFNMFYARLLDHEDGASALGLLQGLDEWKSQMSYLDRKQAWALFAAGWWKHRQAAFLVALLGIFLKSAKMKTMKTSCMPYKCRRRRLVVLLELLFNCLARFWYILTTWSLIYFDNLKSPVSHKEIRWGINTESISKVFVCCFHTRTNTKFKISGIFWHCGSVVFLLEQSGCSQVSESQVQSSSSNWPWAWSASPSSCSGSVHSFQCNVQRHVIQPATSTPKTSQTFTSHIWRLECIGKQKLEPKLRPRTNQANQPVQPCSVLIHDDMFQYVSGFKCWFFVWIIFRCFCWQVSAWIPKVWQCSHQVCQAPLACFGTASWNTMETACKHHPIKLFSGSLWCFTGWLSQSRQSQRVGDLCSSWRLREQSSRASLKILQTWPMDQVIQLGEMYSTVVQSDTCICNIHVMLWAMQCLLLNGYLAIFPVLPRWCCKLPTKRLWRLRPVWLQRRVLEWRLDASDLWHQRDHHCMKNVM